MKRKTKIAVMIIAGVLLTHLICGVLLFCAVTMRWKTVVLSGVRFGATRAQVTLLWGRPDEIFEADEACAEFWTYDNVNLNGVSATVEIEFRGLRKGVVGVNVYFDALSEEEEARVIAYYSALFQKKLANWDPEVERSPQSCTVSINTGAEGAVYVVETKNSRVEIHCLASF